MTLLFNTYYFVDLIFFLGRLGIPAKQWEAILSHLLNPIDIINTSIFGGQKNLLAKIADAHVPL